VITDKGAYKIELRRLKAIAAGEDAVRRFEAREAKRAANREKWALAQKRRAALRLIELAQIGGSL
jgi:hypothetical protein